MRRFERSKNFNGVNVILSDTEFDKWIQSLDNVISIFEDDEEELTYVDKLRSLKEALRTFSYFDKDDKEVHCRLGNYEMELMIECLTLCLPKVPQENGEFEKLIDNPETKLWKN